MGDAQTLVLLCEIKARISRNGDIYENEPIWLTWHPTINTAMALSKPDEVAIAEPLIAAFKQRS
jgi:hypothetical protein